MEMRNCATCKTQKHISDFYSKEKAYSCIDCTRIYFRERYRNDAEYRRKHQERRRKTGRGDQLRIKYGLSEDDYQSMLTKQGGCCALCGSTSFGRSKSKHFVVDHCHVTGKVRGLLCHPCNVRVGSYERLMEYAGADKLTKYLQSVKE